MPSIFGKLLKRKTIAPDPFDALYVQATSAAATQEFQRAIQLYDQAIALNPTHAEAYYKRGNALKILLPFNPDWRWMRDRDDSPWYPTAKLYRQTAAGDWNEVFARVATDLHREFLVS